MKKQYSVEKRTIPSSGGGLKLLILRPKRLDPSALDLNAGVLWIHGGGYVTGMAEMVYFSRASALVRKFGITVVSLEYRLAGTAPYPAALEDCYAALLYIKAHAHELGIRDDQIMVGGESAGGGLCVALCLYARDKGEVNIAYQMPLYPMLDDRPTPSSADNHAPVWNTKYNRKAWKTYLKGLPADQVPAYAAPARALSYHSLPPAYTFVGDIEPFYCETMTYIKRLRREGIEAFVDVYPGRFHAFDMLLPFLKDSKIAAQKFEEHFSYAATHYFAKQNK